MKKIFITILLAALMPFAAGAQDARQRTAETIVADALAQLPARTPKAFDSLMQELAATGADGIRMMAGMLVPAAEGKNAPVEYALNGVVSYVSAQGRGELAREVRAGLTDAVAACTDKPNQAFLLSLLQLCATAQEAPVFVKYAGDKYLADYAVRGLISTPGTDEAILALIDASPAPNALLAYAAAEKGLAAAEPALLEWAADPAAGTPAKEAVYNALAKCGTAASIAPLAAAAKADGYAFTKTDATGAYIALIARLAATGNSKALAAAKALQKTSMPQNVRAAGLGIVLRSDVRKQTSEVLAALKDADREYRCAALDFAGDFADDALYAAIVKKMPSLSDAAKTDVVSWLGTRHAASQADAVIAAISSPDEELALAAIRAAGKIGGQEALNALVAQLPGAHAKEAAAALAAFNGKPNAAFVAALDGDPATQANALKLVAKRRITSAAGKVFALLNSPDREVRTAAYDALAGVTTPADFNRLCGLLNKAQENDVKALQAGLKNALAKEAPDMQYKMVAGQMAAAPQKARYYPLLAQAATDDAIQALLKADDRKAAFAALLTVENPSMIEVLYQLAGENPAWTDAAISRYADFVTKSRNTPMRKYQLYRRGLEAAPAAKVQNKLLKALSKTPVFPALTFAVNYMDTPATAETAALVVKTVAAKNPALGGETVAAALKKALQVYAGLAKSDADAGYAVDEIKGLMAKLPAGGYAPVSLEPDGWKAVVGDPETRKAKKAKALAKAQQEADAAMAKNWTATGGVLTGAADAGVIGSAKNYENFELILEWKTEAEAGLGVRSIPQIALGGKNSGALTGNRLHDNTSPKAAANSPREWNTMQVKVVSDRVTVLLNGVTTAENVILENACNREIPAYAQGQLLLIAGKAPVSVREMYVRELPATPRFELSEEEAHEGFEVLFDGMSMHKWTGNTTNYVPVDGTIYVTAQYGGSGNLYTKKEYGDFVLRFEFAFDREGVNNGIGIRTPMGVDAAYHGMEIQVLDHDAPIYKNLRVYQQHGSVYGIIPAKRVKFPPLGTWNVEEIRAVGDRITVTVNGEVILDGDIRQACQGHNVAPDGGKNNPYTVDHKNHPGLFNASGHIGLLGHGAGIKFRNIRIKELPAAKTKK